MLRLCRSISAGDYRLAVKSVRQIHLIHRFAVPLPLEGKAKSLSLLRFIQRGDSSQARNDTKNAKPRVIQRAQPEESPEWFCRGRYCVPFNGGGIPRYARNDTKVYGGDCGGGTPPPYVQRMK